MSKYRVTYVAVKTENQYRTGKSGLQELIDSRTVYREESTALVETDSEQDAIAAATAQVPAGCEITSSVHKIN